MNYTDTAGQPATGVVWSPGPLPGTVWVLPYSGASASEARVASVWWKRELPIEHVSVRHAVGDYSDQAREHEHGLRLSDEDWHTALGYDPLDMVARGGEPELDLTA